VGCFELERGYCFSTDRPLERSEPLQLDPWLVFTEGIDQRRPNPARGLTGGEGQVRGNAQGLTAVTGVAGVEAERGRGGVTTANRSGRRRPEGRRRRSGGRRAGGRRGSGQGASTR
jgi:hypothetical protein